MDRGRSAAPKDQSTDPVIVPRVEYAAMLRAVRKLEALQLHGVDNWEGYGEAMDWLHDEERRRR